MKDAVLMMTPQARKWGDLAAGVLVDAVQPRTKGADRGCTGGRAGGWSDREKFQFAELPI